MRFVIYGAGAIGAFVGGSLHEAGEDVVLIARGEHLRSIREQGLRILSPAGARITHPAATDDPGMAGKADVVLLSVKAPALPQVLPGLPPLLHDETVIVTAQNGIPWWYFQRHGGDLEGLHLESVDPAGALSAAIPPARIIGCTVYCSAEVVRPGVIHHLQGNRFAIGEIDGSSSERCRRISAAFQAAGLRCPVRHQIRHDIWVKLLGNLAFNPISALTRAAVDEILAESWTADLVREVMEEGRAVASALGVEVGISTDRRIEGARKIGPHRTSMLQDLEAGKPLELGSILGAVLEIADIVRVPAPNVRALYACTRLLEKSLRARRESDASRPQADLIG